MFPELHFTSPDDDGVYLKIFYAFLAGGEQIL
jgi:hypothetical protein